MGHAREESEGYRAGQGRAEVLEEKRVSSDAEEKIVRKGMAEVWCKQPISTEHSFIDWKTPKRTRNSGEKPGPWYMDVLLDWAHNF